MRAMAARLLAAVLMGATAASAAAEAPTPAARGLADPALAMGLRGIADWQTQQPFVDRMKTARPWIGHTNDTWGQWDHDDLVAGGHIDAAGWPVSLPEGADRLEALVLTDMPESASYLAGRYVLRWEGAGHVEIGGRVRLRAHRPGEIVFHYAPGPGLVAVRVKETDPEGTGDHIRNITLVREDQRALHAVGALFNPRWIARVRDLRMLRFLDWMDTNGSEFAEWQDRPRLHDMTWSGPNGVPVEVMVALANEIGADPWFTLPHRVDDDFVRRFATYVRDNLDPRLRVHAEYSNELWNFGFPQAHWARQQAEARWGAAAEGDGWVQFAGLRAAEVADLWRDVFGAADGDRLRTVIGVHTGWLGLEKPLLEAPLAVAEGRPPPAESFDHYAVTGYFGGDLGGDTLAPTVRDWLEEGEAAATARTAQAVRTGSLARLTQELWPYHADAAERYGLTLAMYEGGTHIVGRDGWEEDAALTAFFTSFNYTPEVAALYETLLDHWRSIADTPFNAFVAVSRPSRHGSWGALRHLGDDNPRWDALMAHNAEARPGDAQRADGTFLHGVLREGGAGADTLIGTPEEDTLLGGPGDDRLVSHGGADRLHGGPGRDRAVLPGGAGDWRFHTEEDTVIATRAGTRVRMVEVEEVGFADDPALVFLTASLR
ncbi:hypothetical protein [Rhodosalinus sp.]|uniref:hypothetical protein n=1 Tax=Rhodosalinus sp. TaxID=2047741 RepID=UPI00356AEE57